RGESVGGVTAVVESGDVRVFEAGEDLAFGGEALQDVPGVYAGAEEFEGDLLLELVDSFGEVDRAHAAAAETADDLVGADGRADVCVVGVVADGVEGDALEHRARGFVGAKEAEDVVAELFIASALGFDEAAAEVRWKVQSRVEYLLEAGQVGVVFSFQFSDWSSFQF